MNRRLAMLLAVYGAWSQATVLFVLDPMKRQVSDVVEPEATVGQVQLLGLSLEGFAVRDLSHVQGWLPQVVFLLLGGLLSYGVLRASAGIRPRLRTVVALGGASLLAAGVAMLTGPALDPDAVTAMPTYRAWVVRAQMGEVPGAAAQFALLTLWLPVLLWLLVWRYREWQPLRTYLRTAEDAESDGSDEGNGSRGGREKHGPVSPVSARPRRHLLSAGLIPAVLLAVAGGPVLRHIRVNHLSQGVPGSPDASVTFDPDLWENYRPPATVEEWSGVLYPALRLRPLRTELLGGWIATLVVCAVFLLVLAVALRALARRAAEVRRWSPEAFADLAMKGWYATVLAAVVAAVVDGRLMRWFAPRGESGPAAEHLGVALGDAVRFGAACGWATGLALLGAVLLMTRRAAVPVAPRADEYEDQPVPEREERSAHGD
ncbi:hypothetical protein [Streptomyces sp. Cmuel-A718b]|uniref:hypothetical protein n=1 Tax=Streptomyces sp. Cmuel-A718b TaxID=697328 RepID=UPI00081F36FD|nr:hypothetical protein [Streptomyces sp. Cmuel-A718b]OSC72917.1 hypothetical protein B5180_19115 [Streptomyces sp. BF-3]SCF88501.1 hypothetical protein GA0115280_118213 [Streptomyces sp. Cmuel-A718b]